MPWVEPATGQRVGVAERAHLVGIDVGETDRLPGTSARRLRLPCQNEQPTLVGLTGFVEERLDQVAHGATLGGEGQGPTDRDDGALLRAAAAVLPMAAFSTPVCEALGIEHPIAQAPIGSLTCPDLAAAVSNAGGLGTLAVTWQDPDATRRAIERTWDLTDAPFAVNLVLDDATTVFPTEEHLGACLDAGAPVVSFSFGDPTSYVDRCRDAGVPVLAQVGSAEMARAVADAGVTAVVAQGGDAGGHLQSDVGTMALVPRVDDAVDVPVVAAGGIADGRGLAASLALGADGAWLGTRFVATHEARAHEGYKAAVADASETETVRTDLYDGGWPGRDHRVLVTEQVDAWDAAGRPPPGDRPGEGETVAELPTGEPVDRYDDIPPKPGMAGDREALPHYAGQSAGLTDAVRPAGEVVEAIVAECTEAIDRSAAALRSEE